MRSYAASFGPFAEDELHYCNEQSSHLTLLHLPCADGQPSGMPPRSGGRISVPICATNMEASHLLRRCVPHAGRCQARGDRNGSYKKCISPQPVQCYSKRTWHNYGRSMKLPSSVHLSSEHCRQDCKCDSQIVSHISDPAELPSQGSHEQSCIKCGQLEMPVALHPDVRGRNVATMHTQAEQPRP